MALTATLGTIHAPQLRRVRKAEAMQPAFDKPDPYGILMACWADFMRVDDRDLGSRGMKLASDAENDRDVHEQQRAADLKIGEAVNAMVDSLSIQHRWAICKSQGISRGWRFPNANYEVVLTEARDELENKLRKNLATRLHFSC
jgi:hypothetical protein